MRDKESDQNPMESRCDLCLYSRSTILKFAATSLRFRKSFEGVDQPTMSTTGESSSSAIGESSSSAMGLIRLRSSDNEIFIVKKEVAFESITIKNMIDDDDDGYAGIVSPLSELEGKLIPVPNVKGETLSKVIQYCKKHVEAREKFDGTEGAADSAKMKKFDSEFMKVGKETLFDLILAANYLNIKSLLDLTCQTLADCIKDMSVENVRKTFNIKNDYTPREEEKVRDENKWAFE
ncbi:hypothetical protein NE237_026977 [Protea cynaroides]|uniref:SKP1-like protein n=1 Tax=Protea cynaroides TaxID=273540 RepID=A0A9Q0GMI3_9MAGN|nr:hypothetical protein NE237_026977 [Protea cynaroides]